jgi:hypothetical protein
MTRITTKLEVGQHEGRVGFTMTFADTTAETFLFDDATATELARQLLAVVERLKQARALAEWSAQVRVQDAVRLRLVSEGGRIDGS